MKAIVLKDAGVFEVQDVPEPKIFPDEIKVKIAYSGICGTDPIIIEGKTFGKGFKPEGVIGWPKKSAAVSDDVRIMGQQMRDGMRILGHEASGTIAEIGKDIKGNFKVGQHVAMNFRHVCGDCYYCTNMAAQYCERTTPLAGAMAEYSVYKENMVFPLPDDLPLDVGALLEPLSIAVHSVDLAQMKIGDSVIITGGGPIGLLILEVVLKYGASKVLFSEPVAEKRKLAKQLGADVVVDPLNEDLLAISNKFTDGRGFNVGFEVSGKPNVARQLILLADWGGTVVWVATYPPNLDVGVPIFYMHSHEITIRDVRPSPYAFPKALQMLPKLNLKPLITVFPLTEAVKAFEAQKAGKNVKIIFKM
jgi:(R,R)-butanediol dehydrogenase/meso-butanediol dehydrogenase/diacetyl reductase/L-iditol 2-dehydrogenase